MNNAAGISWRWASANTDDAIRMCKEQPNDMIKYLTSDLEKYQCDNSGLQFKKVKEITSELLQNNPKADLVNAYVDALVKIFPKKKEKITHKFLDEMDTEEASTQESQEFSDVEMTLREAIEANDCLHALRLLQEGEPIEADFPIEFKNKLFLWLCKAPYSKEIAVHIRRLIELNIDLNLKEEFDQRKTALDHYVDGGGSLPVIFCSMNKELLETRITNLQQTPSEQLKNSIFLIFATSERLIEFLEKESDLKFLSNEQIKGMVQFIKVYARTNKNMIRITTQIIYPKLKYDQKKNFYAFMGNKKKVENFDFSKSGILTTLKSLKARINPDKKFIIEKQKILKNLKNNKISFMTKLAIFREIVNKYWNEYSLMILEEIVQKLELEKELLIDDIQKTLEKCKKKLPTSVDIIHASHDLNGLLSKLKVVKLDYYLGIIAEKQSAEAMI